jgi:hypothetical protein
MRVDWSEMNKARKPTRRERGRYKRWRTYLKDSRLGEDEQHRRAAAFAERGEVPPND